MDKEQQPEPTTHFGYREVSESEKTRLVGRVFRSVATRYDLMNDLMSGGLHRAWKAFALNIAAAKPGERVLDLAGGTGDLAAAMATRVSDRGLVVLSDINDAMLAVGRDRLMDRGTPRRLTYVQANAETLPFPDNTFDLITIGFGLRNVTHKDRALAAMCRALKPGGRCIVLEFSHPRSPLLSRLYDAYSFTVVPKLGRYVARDEESYQYLVESIRKHPDQEALKALMEEAGFARVGYWNLTGGIVAVHRGYKL
ncbi:bifunctional demethylmenaquinone methyltransferase/2-methoxy-6-polyprenyl-1,4-benzoquinol methylase UbiE [Acidiferrobacter sp.]|jgi:demethylmenaquinone methyltransferase/2-methoxy-6-polyprenyl-1,4-benzoquinol methylase|uniref:bifunctional demethylmenaquinone methyltransferase/2-methoxy-6-polyprenyl-1,4-benzoquinol methylase UbiE n=1 Tax=Acidiferrobacter sp. TaxID=1872107 RepID=UPI00262A6CFA|nr:bifunctional demethylmenaquinone methyltransferase/2-methoxy-6-polyprenyl-1,4-benzoquinol methylase UbiE [Acidiferrobacter sp.]